MSKIPFINIADVNCWMVYLMPFNEEERNNYELVNKLQQTCIGDKKFGMGWPITCIEYETPMTDENVFEYERYCEDDSMAVSKDAVYNYKSIKEGDFIIMRLKNSHYYVGRVSSQGAFYIYKPNDEVYSKFSWGCMVDEWVEYTNDGEIPSEIVGRFSQRNHSTIQRISYYRQRLLVIAMYESRAKGVKRFDIPKLRIGANNFVRSLSYMELEDLVALYIADKHGKQGYRLIPSSCKTSQQNYEFRFVAPKKKKPITCQVKNQQDIEIEHYIEETGYEKIYIFSGKWNDACVKKLNEKYNGHGTIHIISPSELYEALTKDNIFKNDFYDFENEPKLADKDKLNHSGYSDRKKLTGQEGSCSISKEKDFVYFMKRGLFYSAEFSALILEWHILDDQEREKKYIDTIISDLSESF